MAKVWWSWNPTFKKLPGRGFGTMGFLNSTGGKKSQTGRSKKNQSGWMNHQGHPGGGGGEIDLSHDDQKTESKTTIAFARVAYPVEKGVHQTEGKQTWGYG